MELISLYYFQELSKDLNMTKTASRLYISQQTLSNHIRRLEEYYDTLLFYRKPNLTLTCAGEFVLAFAQTVKKENDNLRGILSDIEHQERGILHVGASMARGTQFLPRILPDFYRRYPNVEVRFIDGLSEKLEHMLSNGELDFSIVLSGDYHPDLISHDLYQDPIYFCIPEVLLQKHYTQEEIQFIKTSSINGANIQSFSRIPFALMTNRLGIRLQDYFQREHVKLNTLFTGSSTSQLLPLCAAGLCACCCSHLSLMDSTTELGDQVNIFPLYDQGHPMIQHLNLLHHRHRYLTHFSKYFMDLMFQTASKLEEIQLGRVVK